MSYFSDMCSLFSLSLSQYRVNYTLIGIIPLSHWHSRKELDFHADIVAVKLPADTV